jgi:hypothetical protein
MIVHYVTDLFISQSKVTNVQACLIESDGKPLQQPTSDEEDKRQEITRRYWCKLTILKDTLSVIVFPLDVYNVYLMFQSFQ